MERAAAAQHESRAPARRTLRSLLTGGECAVLRPYLRRRQRQRLATGSRAPPLLTDQQLDAILATVHPPPSDSASAGGADTDDAWATRTLGASKLDDVDLLCALLRYLDDLWVDFASVSEFIPVLEALHARARAVQRIIEQQWAQWRLVDGSAVVDARQFILSSACVDAPFLLARFAAQGHSFASISDLLLWLDRAWLVLGAERRGLQRTFVLAEDSALFPEHEHDEAKVRARRAFERQAERMQQEAAAAATGSAAPLRIRRSFPAITDDATSGDEDEEDEDDVPPFTLRPVDLHALVLSLGSSRAVAFNLRALSEHAATSAPAASVRSCSSGQDLCRTVAHMHAHACAALFNVLVASAPSAVGEAPKAKDAPHELPSPHAEMDPTMLPLPLQRTGVTDTPVVTLLSAPLRSSLLSDPSDPLGPTSARMQELLSCAGGGNDGGGGSGSGEAMDVHELAHHLAHLANPWRSNSPLYAAYQSFVLAGADGNGSNSNNSSSSSNGLPFSSWEALVAAIRALHSAWTFMRQQALAVLTQHQQAAQTEAAAASSVVSFFAFGVEPIRSTDIDQLLHRSNAGLTLPAWLVFYAQIQSQRAAAENSSASAAGATGSAAVPALFSSFAALQAQMEVDVAATEESLARARATVRNLALPLLSLECGGTGTSAAAVSDAAADSKAPSSQAAPAPISITLTPVVIDAIIALVKPGMQDRSPLDLDALLLGGGTFAATASKQLDCDSALAVVDEMTITDAEWLLRWLASPPSRAMVHDSVAQLLISIRWLVRAMRRTALPEVQRLLSHGGAAHTLAGWLSSVEEEEDIDVSADDAERLVKESGAGPYTPQVLLALVQSDSDVSAAATSFEALVSRVGAHWRSSFLPALVAQHTSLLSFFSTGGGAGCNLFIPARALSATEVWSLLDRCNTTLTGAAAASQDTVQHIVQQMAKAQAAGSPPCKDVDELVDHIIREIRLQRETTR
jgi:hypothetical protein